MSAAQVSVLLLLLNYVGSSYEITPEAGFKSSSSPEKHGGYPERTPRTEPVSRTSPAPQTHDGHTKVVETLSTSSTSRDKDKPNIESDEDNERRVPEPHPQPVTEDQLFKSDILGNQRSPWSSEDGVMTRSPTPGKPQYDLHAVDGSFKSGLVSDADSVETTLSAPSIQFETPTETIIKEVFSKRPHVDPTSTHISVSTSKSGYLVSNSLPSSEGEGEAPSSVITFPLFTGTTSSPEDFKAKQEQKHEEKAGSEELCAPQKDPASNLTLITSRIRKGTELNCSDFDAESDNILASEMRKKFKLEKKLDTVSLKVQATLLPHAGKQGGPDTDHGEADLKRKDGSLKFPEMEVTISGNDDVELYNQSSSDLMFNTGGGIIQSQTETPQHAVEAASQASEFTNRRLQAKPRPGIRGQRVLTEFVSELRSRETTCCLPLFSSCCGNTEKTSF
ncbi:hypothetical protein XENORESO_004099 [Xenotaenia resolanae]|uniref:Uncharacterized protein n=1 Tax=Xenotaenia resolanae TaxID=208358 RepID=A0ABV0X025_9TELE